MPGGRSTAAAAQCRSGWRGWRRWSLDSSHVHMQPMPATMHALEKAAGNHAVRGHALQHPLRIVPVAAFDVGQDFSEERLDGLPVGVTQEDTGDRKSTRLNSSHLVISYAVFCLKKKINHSVRYSALKDEHTTHVTSYVVQYP